MQFYFVYKKCCHRVACAPAPIDTSLGPRRCVRGRFFSVTYSSTAFFPAPACSESGKRRRSPKGMENRRHGFVLSKPCRAVFKRSECCILKIPLCNMISSNGTEMHMRASKGQITCKTAVKPTHSNYFAIHTQKARLPATFYPINKYYRRFFVC